MINLATPSLKIPVRSFLLGLFCALALFVPKSHAEPETPPEPKKTGPLLRILCVAGLVEDEELSLASQDEKGNRHEFSKVKLRSSFISDWLPAATGSLDLFKQEGDAMVSKCHFNFPEGATRVILVLLPNKQKQTYQADVIDPSKLRFAKGSSLLINYSPLPGSVMLGSQRVTVKSGERIVSKPVAEANGMFRMLVAYADQENKVVPCYDRYLPYNPESRDFLLLFPDPTAGLRVYSLSEFGPYE